MRTRSPTEGLLVSPKTETDASTIVLDKESRRTTIHSSVIIRSCFLLFGFLNVPKGTVLAIFYFSHTLKRNVLDRMAQGARATITNRHFSLHLSHWDSVHEFEGVAAVLAEQVLSANNREKKA